MPIRYTRVGWQDAPSTDTPIDAANLNHMDNGILAISQELDTELDSLRDEFDALEQDTSSQINAFKGETSAQISKFSSDITTMQNGLPGMISDKMDDKFGDDIGDNVTSWLTEHVNPAGSAVVVDDTLTIQGAAADAKKTGDEITGLKEEFNYINDGITINETDSISGNFTRQYIRNDGTIGSSTTTCISMYNAFPSQRIKYSVPAGFKISAIAEYSDHTDTAFTRFIQKSDSTESDFVADSSKFYRISIRKTDETAFPLDEIPAEAKQYIIEEFTDKTLKLSGKSADAKAVGNAINENSKYAFETLVPIWEQGTLTTNGSNQSSATRIRTVKMPYSFGARVSINEGVKFSYRAYDQGNTFVVGSNWLNEGATLNLPSNVAYIRFVCAYNDNTNITPGTDTGFKYQQIKTQADLTKSASFRGNVSVRSAKVINFSDGTPPIIDWYLLQNTANDFYMSKDMVSKKYLFTFNPPSSNVANWSVGITASNDIIFVADASGLDGTNRLDDSNRVNPVCFLASENYSVMHVIDFGSAKKPCGWLGNVGYCLLPNNNIAFCEYTRGTVKTANVWLVSGDVSDPNNWTVTWSENIIDVVDSTTAGIKHCHQMQYDFYTGVLYFGTGDSSTGSYSYYSTDNGLTWELLYGPSKNRCRLLTYVFTKDKVYWASDSWEPEYHHFFVADRDVNNLIDVANATQIDLDSTNSQSCYGCVYIKEHECIVMMDRCDGTMSSFNWYCYDIKANSVKKIGEWSTADGSNTYLGFRTEFVDWYPRGSNILVGFNPSTASVTQDTNRNPFCGNGSGIDGDGYKRINNLTMHIYKNNGEYSYMPETTWI